MSRLLKQASILMLIAHATLGSSAASAALPDEFPGLGAYMDGLVEWLMRNNNSASGVVTIVKGNELIFSKGYGFHNFEDRVAVDPETTMVRPGSVSKLFTWVAVMQLVEQGKLDLDADVNDYLENFQLDETFEEPVTLRHIMTHTAGFEDGALGYLIVVDEDKMLPLAEAMEKYQPRRVNPPGAQTSYSNYATALAGLIVANVSGQSFNDYVQANIFDVLGMTSSTFYEPLPAHLESQGAVGYQVETGTYAAKPFELIASFGPAGGLSSSGTDMAKFASAVLNGGERNGARMLREETMREMLARNFSHDDRMMGMALGFYETDENGVRIVGHGGDTFLFHSDLAIDLENDIAIFNSFSGDGGSTVRAAIVPAFYDRFFPRYEEPPLASANFSDRAMKYAGMYQFWRHNFSSIEKVLSLGPGITITPTEDNTLLLSLDEGAKQYVEVDDNLFRELDREVALSPRFSPRLIAFQENTDGSIKGLVIDGLPFMSLYKSPAYANTAFNMTFLALSSLVFIGVLLRLAYQWSAFREMSAPDRSSAMASVYVATSNLLFFFTAFLVVSAYGVDLYNHLPFVFKAMLVLPIVAFAAGLYHAYRLITVWKDGLLDSIWARLRYGVVTACALFMCWFYYFWNILGFQYLA
ncbi:MAG: beta-lactamase family protein [Gammaproteobacteria bacterium]|nr:beta-lactamase family protein [Gammaproteobacteria bacterium]